MKSYTISAATVRYVTTPDLSPIRFALALALIGIATVTFIISDYIYEKTGGNHNSRAYVAVCRVNNKALELLAQFKLIIY